MYQPVFKLSNVAFIVSQTNGLQVIKFRKALCLIVYYVIHHIHAHNSVSFTHIAYSSRLITTTKIDNDAIDSDIIQCVDKGPLDDKADQVNVIGRRRCKLVNTTTTTTTTTKCK